MKSLRLIALLIMGLAMTAALAARLPENYPQGFTDAGTIDAIDLKRRVMILGDMQYPLGHVVRVHETNGKSRDLSPRDVGKEAGISTSAAGRSIVREVWILPSGYLSSHRPVRR
ncbi:MAG TPA: hypothetical protein VLB10_08595 [Gammaproteobacteria bacterium]|jgi:hypothetical protein|nr:hypothetical protein [Gammaproteobacteria bacterium]